MKLSCPKCGTNIDVPAGHLGQPVWCPECYQNISVGEENEALDDYLESDAEVPPRPEIKKCPMCGATNPLSAAKCRACGDPFQLEDDEEPKKHYLLGVASFVIALMSGFVLFASFAVAGYLQASSPNGMDERSAEVMMVGLSVIGGIMLNVVGIVLGVTALFLRDQSKLFAAMGTALGSLILLGIVILLGIGFALQAAQANRVGPRADLAPLAMVG